MSVGETEPKRRRRRPKAGDTRALQHVLWASLVTIEDLMTDPDPALRVKAAHALGTLAGTYLRCLEQVEVIERIDKLEVLVAAQKGPQPVKGSRSWAA